MPQSGFLEQKPRSPGSLAIVVALHGAAIGALLLAKGEFERKAPVVTDTYFVPPETIPPPDPPKPVDQKRQIKSRIDTVTPLVQPPVFDRVAIVEPRPVDPVVFDP